MTRKHRPLVVVANRLPCVVERKDGVWQVKPSSGGLVTAMFPVLRRRGGTWVGWAGTLDEDDIDNRSLNNLLDDASTTAGFQLQPVVLTREERDMFYLGFANEVIWPLFHSLDERCNFAPSYWETNEAVNRKFASVVRETINVKSFLWVHDYHFMTLGEHLRSLGVRDKIGFFLHIPFPPLDIFLKLPWRAELLRAMLAYDTIGFQAARDRRNFLHCVRALHSDSVITGRGRLQTVLAAKREVTVGAFPISIDFAEFADQASSPAVEKRLGRIKKDLEGRKLILGIDRLDYTKGIPLRLRAFRRFLRQTPQWGQKVRFVQVVVPSREMIPSYQKLKEEVEQLVGDINGEFSEEGWVPVHYMFRSLERDELLALYRLADVALVTPLNDGMNLVAKEYCACNIQEHGVLILSEFAGAAAELGRGSLLVNPYDIVGMANAIREALEMPADERESRMARLRRHIRHNDIHRWVRMFLQAAQVNIADLEAAQPAQPFAPTEDSSPEQGDPFFETGAGASDTEDSITSTERQ